MKNRDDIEKLVIVKLEEHTPFGPRDTETAGPILGAGDLLDEVKPIYSYVKANIDTAANEIIRMVPISLLVSEEYDDTCYQNHMRPNTGYFELPSDFLRLHTLIMRGWMKPIHRVFTPSDVEYEDQFYESTAGNYWKPAATINTELDDKRLYYYSLPCCCMHQIQKMLYITDYAHTNQYDDDVAEIIALNCAKKVYEIFGNSDMAGIMSTEIKSKLENLAL